MFVVEGLQIQTYTILFLSGRKESVWSSCAELGTQLGKGTLCRGSWKGREDKKQAAEPWGMKSICLLCGLPKDALTSILPRLASFCRHGALSEDVCYGNPFDGLMKTLVLSLSQDENEGI